MVMEMERDSYVIYLLVAEEQCLAFIKQEKTVQVG